MTDVFEQSVGRWSSILPALGVSKDYLTGRHGPCPRCGGKDRFRFTDYGGRGSWVCNQCCEPPGGDGFDLLQVVNRWDKSRAINEVKAMVIGTEPVRQKKIDPLRIKRLRDERNAIWSAASHDLNSVPGVAAWWLRRAGEVRQWRTDHRRRLRRSQRRRHRFVAGQEGKDRARREEVGAGAARLMSWARTIVTAPEGERPRRDPRSEEPGQFGEHSRGPRSLHR